MADETKQKLPLKEEIVEQARKKVVSTFAKRAGERIEGGENPENVMKALVQTLSPDQQKRSGQIEQLAQEQVPIPGSTTGILPALIKMAKGQGFSPGGERTEIRGEKRAEALLKTMTAEGTSELQARKLKQDLDPKFQEQKREQQIDDAVEKSRRIQDETARLTDDERKAVSGAEDVSTSVGLAIELIGKGAHRDTSKIKTVFRAIAIDSGFPIAVSGVAEELQSEFNNLKSRIPFAKGGKQLTPFEAKILFRLLDIFGKEDKTIVRDLQRFVKEFDRLSTLSIEGKKGARQVKQTSVTSGIFDDLL